MRPEALGLIIPENTVVLGAGEATLTVWSGILPVTVWFTESATMLIDAFLRSTVDRPRYFWTFAASDGSNPSETLKSTLNGALPLATFAGALTPRLIGSAMPAPPPKLLKS